MIALGDSENQTYKLGDEQVTVIALGDTIIWSHKTTRSAKVVSDNKSDKMSDKNGKRIVNADNL